MENKKSMVAIYASHNLAEDAVQKLQENNFDMKQLSIVGRDYHTEDKVVGYYNLGERMLQWGTTGAFWGGIWGLFLGSAFFMIPGVGPLLIAGPFVSSLVGSLEGAIAVGGLSAFGAALVSFGIPKNSVVVYESEIMAGKFMLVAKGTEDETQKAREILGLDKHH